MRLLLNGDPTDAGRRSFLRVDFGYDVHIPRLLHQSLLQLVHLDHSAIVRQDIPAGNNGAFYLASFDLKLSPALMLPMLVKWQRPLVSPSSRFNALRGTHGIR